MKHSTRSYLHFTRSYLKLPEFFTLRLQHLVKSDTASWVLIYILTSLSLAVSLRLLVSPGYFPI
jgi:uncharacterized membrane protein (DUF106 family)